MNEEAMARWDCTATGKNKKIYKFILVNNNKHTEVARDYWLCYYINTEFDMYSGLRNENVKCEQVQIRILSNEV